MMTTDQFSGINTINELIPVKKNEKFKLKTKIVQCSYQAINKVAFLINEYSVSNCFSCKIKLKVTLPFTRNILYFYNTDFENERLI